MENYPAIATTLGVSFLFVAGAAFASAQSSGITLSGYCQYMTDSDFGGEVLKIGYGGPGTGIVDEDSVWTETDRNLVVGCCPNNLEHARLEIYGTANTKDTWVSVKTRTGDCLVDGGTWNNSGKFYLGSQMEGTLTICNGGKIRVEDTFRINFGSALSVDETSMFELTLNASGSFGAEGGIYVYNSVEDRMVFEDASAFTIDAGDYKNAEESFIIENLICANTSGKTADLGDLTFEIGENSFLANDEDSLNRYLSGLTVLGYENYAKSFIVDATSQTVSLRLTQIPEPSAFGLLAGLGALVLVGTRRRRK